MKVKAGTEIVIIDGRECLIGRDPRSMSREDIEAVGHTAMPVLKALRARCIDCCAGSATEVRHCTAVECSAWPFRMGTNPWRAEMSEEQRTLAAARLAKALAAKKT
jgi:hypothetical protein